MDKRRPKHNFPARDLTRLLLTLWTMDDLIFTPERYRIQSMFIVRVYCWTGARLSAFSSNGLRYRGVVLVLQRTSAEVRCWCMLWTVKRSLQTLTLTPTSQVVPGLDLRSSLSGWVETGNRKEGGNAFDPKQSRFLVVSSLFHYSCFPALLCFGWNQIT